MRITLVSRYPYCFDRPQGGVESVTVILARALAKLDNLEVHILTLEKNLSKGLTEKDGQVTIHRMPRSSCPEIIDIHLGPGRKQLLSKIQELSPAIVHSHETYGLTFGELSTPHVFTVHGFDHANIPAEGRWLSGLRSILWKWAEDHSLGKHKNIISISPYVKEMIRNSAPLANVYDIDNPVDYRYFSVKPREDTGRILLLGWINERKNTLGAVRAFAHAIDSGCDGRLIIAGEHKLESYKKIVLSEIKERKIQDRVDFLGHINRDQLMEELCRTSILLLPSLQENAPMAISEAMAAGVPVIASDRCGMPYMVAEGKSGFLIDPLNTTQIAEKITELLTEPRKRKEMGDEGRKIASLRFHPDVVARKTYAVYQQILFPHSA